MEVLQYTYKTNGHDAYKVQVSTTDIAQSWNKFKVRARKLPPAEYCSYGMQTGGRMEVWNAEASMMEEVPETSWGTARPVFFKDGRAGEDTDRVEVSMANILGYLMSYQLLGGGQKQISKDFFGNDGQVNNINKGKSGEGGQAFKNLIPLLDKYRVKVIGE